MKAAVQGPLLPAGVVVEVVWTDGGVALAAGSPLAVVGCGVMGATSASGMI